MLKALTSRVKAVLGGLLLLLAISVPVYSQSCPAQGTEIFPELSGEDLINALADEYEVVTDLGYDRGRDTLYASIDNVNGQLSGIYTGYTITLDANEDPSVDAYSKNVDAEHAWPQSKGAGNEPAKSDLHHLYPAYSPANGSRGNQPFYEIPDGTGQGYSWWRDDESVSTPDYNYINEYSERWEGHPSGLNHPGSDNPYHSWEPREAVKGDIARSMFYFYTMYRQQAIDADPNFFEVQKEYLRQWNSTDSVSAKEYERTCAIASHQGNVNPFVIDPTLVERAFFEGQISQTNVQFSASVFSVSEGEGTLQIELSIFNPNADTATTVDVSYAGGTATPGDDFEDFTTQTVTFPEGSYGRQSVELILIDDGEEEQNETIVLELQNVDGPANAVIGEASTLEITMRDNDGAVPTAAWINEFHYDNDGTDEGEFVEVAVNAAQADLSGLTLTLYNGSNGESYGSYSGGQFEQGASENGITFYYVDLPANGLQNGSPDGMSLDLNGELIQFISYEGTFTASGGPADGWESRDTGAEQPGSAPIGSSLQLAGTGGIYDDFSWELLDEHTKGAVNTNQVIEGVPVPDPDSAVVEFETSTISVFEDTGSVMIPVQLQHANPDEETQVEVAVAGGTASENDFEFTSPQTLTFSGSENETQSMQFRVKDNDAYDPNRTVVLALQNVSGAEIGATDTLEITIRNNDEPELGFGDYWVNEFHYQNAGADTGEFVEIVKHKGLVFKESAAFQEDELQLSFYNGANGETYETVAVDSVNEGPEGYLVYWVEVDGIQNGDPDGMALSVNGELVQFISYGGTFTANDGIAADYESIDVGVTQSGDAAVGSALALTGSGEFYDEFDWSFVDSSTPGAENTGQDLQIVVSNEEEPAMVREFALHQNYPNPFNPSTVISYQLPVSSEVRLKVFDMLGREVAELVNSRKTAGKHQVVFDAANLSSGVYIYQLKAGNFTQTQKMTLVK